MRVIDALQLPDVMSGKMWFALELPGGHVLPTMTIGIDPERKEMYWCDGIYHKNAVKPSHFGGRASLFLYQLLGECTLVDPYKKE